MIRARHVGGRALPLLLAVSVFASEVVVPVLDRERGARGSVLEAEHDPARCLWLHDHSICRLVGGSPPRHSDRIALAVPVDGRRIGRSAASDAPPRAERTRPYRSRAPPA